MAELRLKCSLGKWLTQYVSFIESYRHRVFCPYSLARDQAFHGTSVQRSSELDSIRGRPAPVSFNYSWKCQVQSCKA